MPHSKYQHSSDLPFLIVNFLGAGGYGNVDLAKDVHNPSANLVRKSYQFSSGSENLRARLQYITNEVQMLQRLQHRHIVKLVSTYETPNEFSFLMWPFGERNLNRFLYRESYEEKHTPAERRLLEKWIVCLATAATYVHSQGVCFKAISPTNIICKGEEVYFVDFACAEQFDAEQEESCQMFVSVPYFEAPEMRVLGRAGGFPADVFSLGAIFSMMSTIISGDSFDEFEKFRLPRYGGKYWRYPRFYSSFSLIETWLMRHPLEYNKLIMKMLSESPDNRPTAAETVEALVGMDDLPHCGCTIPFRASNAEAKPGPNTG